MDKCVKCMHRTVQVFLHPIYEAARKEPSMLEPCTKQGLSLYESLYVFNNVLREDLDKSILSWSDATSLGPIFLRIVGFFKMYSQYAGQYNLLVAMINFIAFDNPRYEALVKGGEQRMATEFGNKAAPIIELATNTRIIKPFQLRSVLSLGSTSVPAIPDNYDFYSFPSLLLAPICFIQTQATLLRSLTLATPRSHPDFAQLNTALTHFEETIKSILMEADIVYKTLFVQHTIRSSTIGLFGEPLPARRLLKEGTLTEVMDGIKLSYMVFLFSDMVAFTDAPTSDGFHMLKKYELISDCKVSDPDVGFDNKKGFQLKTKEQTLMLYAQTEKDKHDWLQAFMKAQQSEVRTIKTSLEPAEAEKTLSDFENTLRDLKSGDCDKIVLHSLKVEEGKSLISALLGNQELMQLSITNSPPLGDRFMSSLSTWLATSPSLTNLTLDNVSLTSAAAVALSDSMHINVNIVLLDLRNNSISDLGALALADAIIVSEHLSVLLLDNNAIGEVGAQAIATNLKHNHTLSTIGLEGNPIPHEVMVHHFADCVMATLVTPLTVISFESLEFQKKVEPTLLSNKRRKERKESEINPTGTECTNQQEHTVDLGYTGSGELTVQMITKANMYQGNTRMTEVAILRLDHNSFTRMNESVLSQLTGLHTLLAYHNVIREISLPISLNKLTHLDLAHNRLMEIPHSIYCLNSLTMLDVSCNNISAISVEIRSLTQLHTLMLQTNQLPRLPKELLSMTTLTSLSVGGNNAIPTTSQKILSTWAARSTKLNFSHSCITALPTDISILTRLTELDLSHNELKTIPPQIGDLTNLHILNLSHNPQMESLPIQLWKLSNLQKLHIEGNHANMYDGFIKANMETSAILAALKQQASSKTMQACYRLKLMLVGQENVGKTTLAKALKRAPPKRSALTMRLKEGALAIGMLAPMPVGSSGGAVGNNFSSMSNVPAPNVSTDGIEMEEWEPEDDGAPHPISFTIWDFAGQEVYYATHAFFLSARSIFIVCFNMATGDDAAKVPYWLECISAWGPGSNVVIVGTHLDEVSKDRADQWAEEVKERYMSRFPNVKKFLPISGKSAKNIGKLQRVIQQLAQEDDAVKILYPSALFQLEGLLQSERAMHQNTPPVITRADFAAMARCCGLDDIPAALEDLHRLGVLLYFRDASTSLSDIVILDPKWLARLMATLITTKKAFVKQGILLSSQLDHIWRAPDFPVWLHPALLSMVQRFELCYPLPVIEGSSDQRFLVPSLLPDAKPAALSSLVLASLYAAPTQNIPASTPAPDVIPACSPSPTPASISPGITPQAIKSRLNPMLSFSGVPLVRLYMFKFLPFGFFSRLMIRVMNFLDPVHYWKTGIVLHKDDNQVCVEYRPHNHIIIVQVWGANAAAFWRYIRESIALLIEGWYKRLSFQIFIPCLCSTCIKAKVGQSGLSTTSSTSTLPLRPNPSSSFLISSQSTGTSLSSIGNGVKTVGNDSPAQAPTSADQQESFSDMEMDKKGKFRTLRQSFRVMVGDSRRRAESANASNPTIQPNFSLPTATPKADFVECHLFSYTQCEAQVISAQRTAICPKSKMQIPLDSIVPELTMADLSKFSIKFSDLEIDEKIATGGFGAVFKGKLNGSQVAVKQLIEEVHDDLTVAYREFWREVFMSSMLQHKCIVALIGFTVAPCSMVMEYMPSGNLYSYLRSRSDLTWLVKLKIATNIADAMTFLHSQKPKICHRDLKSPNILMADKSDPDVLCKISDFGESRLVATSGQGRENLANPIWLAPEVMRGGEYTEKCDVYSFGLVMWELLTGAEPFDEYPVAHSGFMSMLEDEIIAGLRPTIPATCNGDYRALIEAAWDDDPEKRPTFAAIHTELLAIKAPKFNPSRR
eukprot:Phypoly_transcript_00223.p1 GENE.Phypoly_transcript_00223~~Phypoly_transcript_00223.p1  ORF type:complete len:1946 (-),score=272.21 Phypoly_transcript_00223:42-5636(-)